MTSRRNARHSRRGFTLIELMLVVTLIAIIMGIAIPSMIESKKRGNECSAISTMRTLSTAELQYRIRYGTYGTLADLVGAGSMDDSFSDGEKSGYAFASAAPTTSTWSVTASPATGLITGDRHFLVDESGVIRFSETGPQAPTDTPVD